MSIIEHTYRGDDLHPHPPCVSFRRAADEGWADEEQAEAGEAYERCSCSGEGFHESEFEWAMVFPDDPVLDLPEGPLEGS